MASLDFVADQFIDGRRLRILVVVDNCTRECLEHVPPELNLRGFPWGD
jgi:hypothetical protein